jgi:exopolysaccharide biosynthesis polyprenyl glycosylphosphotransferase
MDAAVMIGSIYSMAYVRFSMNSLPFITYMPVVKYRDFIFIAFPLLWVIVYASFSIYDGKKYLHIVDEISAITIASIVATIVQAGILYLTFRDFSRALFIIIIGVTYLLCMLWRIIARVVFHFRKETSNLSKKILIIGDGSEVVKLEKNLKKKTPDVISSIQHIQLKSEMVAFEEESSNFSKTLEEICAAIVTCQITDVIIALSRPYSSWIQAITSRLEKYPLGVWISLDLYDLALSDTRIEDLAGISLIDMRAPALDEYSRIVKRIFDLVVGTLVTLLLSPLMIIVSGLILLFDGWPIFFIQKRVGENGKEFDIIKFRTMVRNAEKLQHQVESMNQEGKKVHKVPNDPRVTKLGKFLRRFSLDELPQFFNVINGDMSLVGPRPELPYLVMEYEHWQRRRLSVPPGITGWWQVNGRSDNVMHLHTEDDIYYVENYSIWLDLKILIRTVWVVIAGKGAF